MLCSVEGGVTVPSCLCRQSSTGPLRSARFPPDLIHGLCNQPRGVAGFQRDLRKRCGDRTVSHVMPFPESSLSLMLLQSSRRIIPSSGPPGRTSSANAFFTGLLESGCRRRVPGFAFSYDVLFVPDITSRLTALRVLYVTDIGAWSLCDFGAFALCGLWGFVTLSLGHFVVISSCLPWILECDLYLPLDGIYHESA